MMSESFPLSEFESRLDYLFENHALLEAALTHPSLTSKGRERGLSSTYERLEFLGDRVLGLVVAKWLFELFPNAAEGELAKRHAALVNRDALKQVAEDIGMDHHLQLVQGTKAGENRQNLAALSDAMEAVIGAMYLDGGLDPAERFIKKRWDHAIHAANMPADPKSALQEWAQGKGYPLPIYSVVERSGPAHAPMFKIRVTVKGFSPITCEGKSKREAEKLAAEGMLAVIGL